MDVTVASFDEAAKIEPVVQLAMSRAVPVAVAARCDRRCATATTTPEYANYLASVVSNQHPDHDTTTWSPSADGKP